MSGHFDDEKPTGEEHSTQHRICPHCLANTHHPCDAQGCERRAQDLDERIQIGPTDV